MKNRMHSALIGLMLVAAFTNFPSLAASPVDCNCLTNLPGLQVTCPGNVPDLCALAVNCFNTNYMPGSCTQNFPPGMQFAAGTYPLTLQVMDLQSNVYNCTVSFVVNPVMPPPGLTVTCPTNSKTVECGSGWTFDPPVIVSSCCGFSMPATDTVISNSPCSQVITRNWQITDGCGNQKTCSQTVTVVDTTPPGLQCSQNLVPNWNFESYTNCPDSISRFDYAAPWFTPSPDSIVSSATAWTT